MENNPLSIIVPTWKEQGTIQLLVERINQTAALHKLTYEIIFVDDHSTDRTQGNLISHVV